jgi:hypothetical protein
VWSNAHKCTVRLLSTNRTAATHSGHLRMIHRRGACGIARGAGQTAEQVFGALGRAHGCQIGRLTIPAFHQSNVFWLPLQTRVSESVTRTTPAVVNWWFGCHSSPGRRHWTNGPYAHLGVPRAVVDDHRGPLGGIHLTLSFFSRLFVVEALLGVCCYVRDDFDGKDAAVRTARD